MDDMDDSPGGDHLVPPESLSHRALIIKRTNNNQDDTVRRFVSPVNECSIKDYLKLSLRDRPWICFSKLDNSSKETDSNEFGDSTSEEHMLPEGVVHGCTECSNCLKVFARWRPKEKHKPTLDDAPVFHPNEEEFQDTLKYIESIRHQAESYGICRLVPPPSWNPPCVLKEDKTWKISKFPTFIQQIDKLQSYHFMRKIISREKCKKALMMENKYKFDSEDIVDTDAFESCTEEKFGFERGPEFTLEDFESYANHFKMQYFTTDKMDSNNHFSSDYEPTVDDIECEYWRIIDKPTETIKVLHGANLGAHDIGKLLGGGPCSSNLSSPQKADQYLSSGWNLKNFSRLPGSILRFEDNISGISIPRLNLGMCFSSFYWRVEDHHLYTINYMHFGAPKVWYAVPGRDAAMFEAIMRKNMPDLFKKQRGLLHEFVTQFSPSILKSEGVHVYRTVQHPGEFVLTFPRVYHSGFSCGFNCLESVNGAPISWLPHGQIAVELYREQAHKVSLSHDKYLFRAAREAVKANWEISFLRKFTEDNLRWKGTCGKDGILYNAMKTRVLMEQARREHLCSLHSQKMDTFFDSCSEKECAVCHYDLYLSAAGCQCSTDKFSCLYHAKKLCRCPWKSRIFFFRYEINELHVLVEALGGKLSAIHKWASHDIGLTLRSIVTKSKSEKVKMVPLSRSSLKEDEQKSHVIPTFPNHEMNSPETDSGMVKPTMKYTVELLDLGYIVPGNQWRSHHTVYPKGFRSKVMYISVFDPTQTCYYVSEVLDAGLPSPLFMVSVENSPNEVFIHVSATKCWDMVRERIIHEMKKLHDFQRKNVLDTLDTDFIDGLEMFGFRTPAIMKAIESMDFTHVSTENQRRRDEDAKCCITYYQGTSINNPCDDEMNKTGNRLLQKADTSLLRNLFKKANLEELQLMYEILTVQNSIPTQKTLIRVLQEEIERYK